MPVVTMRQLLEAGVHFGHQTRRWNPKMRRFIHNERNGIYIIDIQQTIGLIERAYEFVRDAVAKGGTVLFVGTKRQAQEAVEAQATRVGMPFVNYRWLGGMLTNFETIRSRLERLEELEQMEQDGTLELALFSRNFALVPDALVTLTQDFRPDGADWGVMGWNEPALTDRLDDMLATSDDEAEIEAGRAEVTEIIQAELPLIPVAWYRQSAVVNERVDGFDLDALERSWLLSDLSWAD
jgi:hypothetical protein